MGPFGDILKQQNPNCTKDDDIDTFYTNITEAILRAADLSIPKYSAKKTDKHSGNVWWNEKCQCAVDKKKLAFKDYLRDKSTVNFI